MNIIFDKHYLIPKHGLLALMLSVLVGLFANPSAAGISQLPLYLTTSVDPNVLIDLSVEGPMGGAAYSDQAGNPAGCTGRSTFGADGNLGACYFPATEYMGYFNPNRCYDYSGGQFNPGDAAIGHACSSSSSKWSGNFLNWATMTAIDEFIWAMTGGNRVTDTTTATVVRRARSHPSWFPVKVINSTINVAPNTITPFSDATLYIENAPPTVAGGGRFGEFKMNVGTTYASATSTAPDKGVFDIKARVCETSANKEANCVAYNNGGSTYYKPEGLIHRDSGSKRFALVSYTLDNTSGRHGGVLRSKMKYVGPQKPDGSGTTIANTATEFGADGILIDNPDAATGGLNSGIINYINKFSDEGYKSGDPVSELFYESLRYFKNLGPTVENYTGIIRNTSDPKTGGFWFYQDGEWDDPIQFSCQKNAILAINDAYPWLDKRLPGTAFTTQTISAPTLPGGTYDLDSPRGGGADDWGSPSNPDAGINVKSLTDQVGRMEDSRIYQSGNPGSYTFDLSNLRVGGGNGNYTATCSRKNISGSGLGSAMGTCPANALDTDGAGRDNTYYVAGLAWYANTTDLRPDISDAIVPENNNQYVSTFMIDTQEYHARPNVGPTNPLWLAGKYGGFAYKSTDSDKDPNTDNTGAANKSAWDADNDGEPDNYFLASDPYNLVNSLNKTFVTIGQAVSSASGVAANSSQLRTGTQIFQATFDSTDWSGGLKAFNINPLTGVLTQAWTDSLPAYGSRNIYTYKPSAAAGSRGVVFDWNNLTRDSDSPAPLPASQQSYLNTLIGVNDGKGALRVDWLRGNNANEKLSDTDTNPAHIFRKRSKMLGDIINSDALYVGTEDYGYGALPSIGTSYKSFRGTSAYANRKPMLYVGANDGMLHGFNADKTSGGGEIFAYVPNALYPELSKLTSPDYVHQYYVDGASAVGDAYDGTNWHTVLASTTGAGGRAVFALDVTNPNAFGAGTALWEYSSTNKPDGSINPDGADLGYTLGQPSVVRMEDGSWAVIVANGYNSDNGHAVLFVLNALTGAVLQKIDTGVGTTTNKNGLSAPVAVDTNGNRSVDTVYAGDLYGNLWKFNLSGSAGSWPVPASPLFVACATNGTSCNAADRQPITGRPSVGKPGGTGTDQNGMGIMVYFGTGKYFETIDNTISNGSQKQAFYGLWDKLDGTVINDRALLQEQTINFEGSPTGTGTANSSTVRSSTRNTVCYASTTNATGDDTPTVNCSAASPKRGWAMTLVKPANIVQGERVISAPVFYRNLVIFSTLIPRSDTCRQDPKSRVMLVESLTGKRPTSSSFDLFDGTSGNSAGKVDAEDMIQVGGNSVAATGVDLGVGGHSSVTLIGNKGIVSGTTGDTASITLADDSSGGKSRKSWRQLR